MLTLIDFSNVAYLSFYGSLRANNIKPEECPEDYIGHIDSFKKKIDQIYQKGQQLSDQQTMVFVLDDKPTYRLSIYPEYKASRKKMTFSPKKALMDLIKFWNIKTVISPGNEADDIIATMVAEHSDDTKVGVVTTDKDIWQINTFLNTFVMNPQTLDIVTEENLRKDFEINHWSKIKLHKALFGDSSDNMPNNTPRMQRYLLQVINDSDGNLDTFYELLKSVKVSDRCEELLKKNKEAIKINYRLAKLRYNCDIKDYVWEDK